MARNVYFSHGTRNEQYLVEDLIVESLSIYGQDFYYIPRSLVAKDEILGEDRLSEFKSAYPVEMYMENVEGFEGQGAFMQKFGLMMEQTATLVVARRRWEQLVGRFGQTIIPTRPNEGDLIYYPLSKGLFEIKFVQHQDPFYQLGKLYVYKLQVELFQYASERINTGVAQIDVFEELKTFDVDQQADIDVPDSFGDNNKFKTEGTTLLFDQNNPFGDVITSTARVAQVSADTLTITTDSSSITADVA